MSTRVFGEQGMRCWMRRGCGCGCGAGGMHVIWRPQVDNDIYTWPRGGGPVGASAQAWQPGRGGWAPAGYRRTVSTMSEAARTVTARAPARGRTHALRRDATALTGARRVKDMAARVMERLLWATGGESVKNQ